MKCAVVRHEVRRGPVVGDAWCEHNDYPETCPPCRRAAGVDPSLAHGLAIEDEVLDWQPIPGRVAPDF